MCIIMDQLDSDQITYTVPNHSDLVLGYSGTCRNVGDVMYDPVEWKLGGCLSIR